MNLALLQRAGELLTRTYDGPVDALGDPTWQETSTAVACELQGAGSFEDHEDAVQVSSWRLFLPATADALRGWDAVRIDGDVYELLGDPSPVFNPRTQSIDHVEAIVQRVNEGVAA